MVVQLARILLTTGLLLGCCSAQASDPASNASMIAWLKTIADRAKQELESAKEALSIAKHMKEMESLRTAKDIAGTGREIQELASDFSDVMRAYERVTQYPYQQLDSINEDVMHLRKKAANLGQGGVIEGMDDFGALLARADRFALVREALNRANKRKAKGQTESDAIRSTESNTALMTELLLGQEEARLLEEAKKTHRKESMSQVRIRTAPAFRRFEHHE